MSVKEGDVVEVLQFEDETGQEGWWMVRCADGKQGLMPDNFVELIQNAPGRKKNNSAYMIVRFIAHNIILCG